MNSTEAGESVFGAQWTYPILAAAVRCHSRVVVSLLRRDRGLATLRGSDGLSLLHHVFAGEGCSQLAAIVEAEVGADPNE